MKKKVLAEGDAESTQLKYLYQKDGDVCLAERNSFFFFFTNLLTVLSSLCGCCFCTNTYILAHSSFLLLLQFTPFLICVYTVTEKINMISFPPKWKTKGLTVHSVNEYLAWGNLNINIYLCEFSLSLCLRWQILKLSSQMGSVIIWCLWLITFPMTECCERISLLQLSAQKMTYRGRNSSCSFRLTSIQFF